MKIEYFDKQHHYEILCSWWKKHEHAEMNLSSLSPLGVVVFNEDNPVCMSFMYITPGCDFANIMWTTTNPEIDNMKQRHQSVETAIDALIIVAQKLNIKKIMTLGHSKGLTKLLTRKGFVEGMPHTLLIGGL